MLSVQFAHSFTAMSNADPMLRNYLIHNKFSAHYYLLVQRSDITLSAREKQCALLLSEGKSAREIGMELNISPRTAEIYISRLKQKFNAKNKTHLVKRLIEAGII